MKVGKAIYNILSQSKDVQSNFPFNTTDYSPTGTELVTNGDFTETGTELVINGDFLSASSWNVNSNWNINTALGVAEADGTSNADINQGAWLPVIGKSYKVTFEVVSLTQGRVLFKMGGVNGEGHTTIGIKTEYIVATSTARLRVDSEDSFIGSVTNVSVKELGENWVPQPIDPDSVSFDENGLTLVQSSDLGDNSRVYQSNVTEDDKSYKVTYTIHSVSLAVGSSVQYYVGNGYVDLHEQGIGTHTFYYTRQGTSDTWFFNLRVPIDSPTDFVTISSISVEEMVLNKIFPELAPPDIDAPYVVYSVVSNSPSDTKNANGDIDTASIEVYGFQDTYNKAVDLGVSVRAALDRKTGTYNTIEIQSTNYVNEQMDVNEARKLWAAIQDYSIRIKNL